MKRWIFWSFVSILTFFVGSFVFAVVKTTLDFNKHASKFDPQSIQEIEIEPLERPIISVDEPAEFDPTFNYAIALKVKLLQTGEFHEDEVPYRSGEKWLGLFRVGNSYQLMETTLRTNRIKEEGLYDTEVSTTTPYEAVFLLRDAKGLKPGSVETVFDSRNDEEYGYFSSSNPKGFGLRGTFWTLRVENLKLEQASKGTRLLLERDGFDPQVLRDLTSGCDDCSWSVEWVGDLNRDGRLDFLIDLSGHYNSYRPTLFMSTEVGDDKMVRILASYHGVGC